MDPAVTANTADPVLQQLRDKQDIYEVVLRYCRGVDRRDMSLVRSAYHPDGIDHHFGFDGTVDDFVGWLSKLMTQYTSTAHFIGNHLATINDDRAVAETYNISVHRVPEAGDPRNFTVGVRYIDQMERRGGRWAIAERWSVRDWIRSDANQVGELGNGPLGSRHPHDALYRALDWLKD